MEDNNYKSPKIINFPSDVDDIKIENGEVEIKVLCSDNKYHWVSFNRYDIVNCKRRKV